MGARPIWIHGPFTDGVLAWLWLPVFVAAHALASRGNAVPVMMAVAAHALEYFVIVDSSLRKRVRNGDRAPVILAVRTRWRRAAVYITYLAAMIAVPFVTFSLMDGLVYAWIVVVFGGMHVLYDGFVWKLRRPATAVSLGIPVPV